MTYRKKRKKSGTIVAIVAAAIAVAALVIIISIIGDPAGRKRVADSGSQSGNSQPTTQSVSAKTEKNTELEEETTESETKQTETTQKETESDNADGTKTNPKYYEDAIDTEREAEKRVYLSFDDGPSVNTDRVLDILKKYDIKATFFNISTDSEELLAAERRAYDEGHTIAIHTVSHEYDKVYASFDAWKADILGEQENIKNNIGITTKYYRFPGGSSNSQGVKYGTDISKCIEWLDENGFIYQDWNVSNEDAEGKTYTADELAQNVIEPILNSGGSDYMVLMHDTKVKNTTIESLPKVIETLKAEGYTFCQLTDNTKEFHHHLYEG